MDKIKNQKIRIKISNPSSSLWRTSLNKKSISFTFTKQDLNKLLLDKLRRTVNKERNLYKCKLFKKCNRKKIKRYLEKEKKKKTTKKASKTFSKSTSRERLLKKLQLSWKKKLYFENKLPKNPLFRGPVSIQ